LTCRDMDWASRAVAHSLGIPVIDLCPRPSEGPGAFSIVGPATRRTVGFELAQSADDAFILVTSGTTSRPKMVPLTHASVCLAVHVDERGFVISIVKPDLGQAVGQQRQADDGQE